jgi:hypothetical protein
VGRRDSVLARPPSGGLAALRRPAGRDTGAILGSSSEGDEHEIRGIEAVNPFFSRVLRQHFDQMWEQSVPWQDWAAEFMLGFESAQTDAPIEELVEQWALSMDSARALRELLQPDSGLAGS